MGYYKSEPAENEVELEAEVRASVPVSQRFVYRQSASYPISRAKKSSASVSLAKR